MSSQKETVIITGSSGLIGSATAKWLAPLHAVVGFDVVPPAVSPSNVEWMSVDLNSPESIRKGLNKVSHDHGERVASVIHLAGYYDSSGEPSPKYEAINIQGTQHLLQELQRFHVEQFIYSSTMLVHAPCQPGARINEDWPL